MHFIYSKDRSLYTSLNSTSWLFFLTLVLLLPLRPLFADASLHVPPHLLSVSPLYRFDTQKVLPVFFLFFFRSPSFLYILTRTPSSLAPHNLWVWHKHLRPIPQAASNVYFCLYMFLRIIAIQRYLNPSIDRTKTGHQWAFVSLINYSPLVPFLLHRTTLYLDDTILDVVRYLDENKEIEQISDFRIIVPTV